MAELARDRDSNSEYDRSGDDDDDSEWDPDGCENCGRTDCETFLERLSEEAAQIDEFGVVAVVV